MTVDIAMLSEAMKRYLVAVGASDGPYEPRHGRTANWALRHKLTETIVQMQDGRQGCWESFPLAERINPGIARILGQVLTEKGLEARALLLKDNSDAG